MFALMEASMDESYIERDSYSTFIDDHDLRSLGVPEFT
jgi:hypothetical protein